MGLAGQLGAQKFENGLCYSWTHRLHSKNEKGTLDLLSYDMHLEWDFSSVARKPWDVDIEFHH